MNKIMIAAAVAASAVAAFADVTSANIVGYQQGELKNSTGYNFVIPTFGKIGAETPSYSLQDIVLLNAEGNGKVECIVMYNNQAVLTGDMYYWCEPGKCSGITTAGWYTYRGKAEAPNIALPAGTGLYLNLPNAGVIPQFNGEVITQPLTNEFPNVGYNMVGNSTPVSIHVQDIKLVDAEANGKVESIVMYNNQAVLTGDMYYWCEPGKCSGITTAGWYTYRGKGEIENFEIKPGQGLYFNIPTVGVKYVIPSPL